MKDGFNHNISENNPAITNEARSKIPIPNKIENIADSTNPTNENINPTIKDKQCNKMTQTNRAKTQAAIFL